MLRQAVLPALLLAAAIFAQTDPNPAARRHVRMEGDSVFKYTSRLATVVELNFTMNSGYESGKDAITEGLSRISASYGGIKVHSFTSTYRGNAKGVVPNFTSVDLLAGEVLVANNISSMGDSALGGEKQNAIRDAIETQGRGYLAFHGSGSNQHLGWPWFTETLHPWKYSGMENGTEAPVYKDPDEARHIVLQGILESRTTKAIAPYGVDSSGNEVLTTEPIATRSMRTVWFKWGRDISREPAYMDKVTTLLKYDARNMGSSEMDPEFKRKGGNLLSWLYAVGNGMTSYILSGHDRNELMAPATGFDGGVGDFDRYVAQTLFFLAGYHREPCDSSCKGLPIVDDKNRLTGALFPSTTQVRTNSGNRAPEVSFKSIGMGFSSVFSGEYEAVIQDLQGRPLGRKRGTGPVTHAFETSVLKPGVYFLRVRFGSRSIQVKRYAWLAASR